MTGQNRTEQVRTGHDRTEQDRAGQVRTGQDRTGQDRTGQDAGHRTGQDRTGQDSKAAGPGRQRRPVRPSRGYPAVMRPLALSQPVGWCPAAGRQSVRCSASAFDRCSGPPATLTFGTPSRGFGDEPLSFMCHERAII